MELRTVVSLFTVRDQWFCLLVLVVTQVVSIQDVLITQLKS